MGKPLSTGQFADFAVIWDEDHDVRAIEPIEKIYRRGLLPCFLMFGERKGCFTAVLGNATPNKLRRAILEAELTEVTEQLDHGDSWTASVVHLESPENAIIADSGEKTLLYLKNLLMLWQLGVKSCESGQEPGSIMPLPFNPAFLANVDELGLSAKAADCLKRDNIVYIGDLVQKTEAEMLRTPNFGRRSLNEIKEVLAQIDLRLGLEVPSWPPENIDELAKRYRKTAAA